MSLARDRYTHHCRQLPMWGDDRSWYEWEEKRDRLWLEQVRDPETVAELKALIASQQKTVDTNYTRIVEEIKSKNENAGKPGYSDHGMPLHACHGHRRDEHVWVWHLHLRRTAE